MAWAWLRDFCLFCLNSRERDLSDDHTSYVEPCPRCRSQECVQWRRWYWGVEPSATPLLAALTSADLVDDPTLPTSHPTGRRALSADEAQRVAAVVADTLGDGS